MSKKIYGDLNVDINVSTGGKNVIRDINDITPDQDGELTFPYYTQAEFEQILTMFPISRVGTMDYLPMSINGSFEGANDYPGKGIYPTVLENDGTLVYLRPGTNGSTFGYYYCYQSNVRTVTTISPVQTNSQYTPPYFTENHTLTSFVGSNSKDIMMCRSNDGTQNTYGLILTNGTLNMVSHVAVEFPMSLISDTNPQYVMLQDDIVYIWCLDGYTNTSPLSISLYTINKSDITSGIYSSLTKVTGFSGTNLYGDTITNSTNIKLADKYFSQDLADKPLFYISTDYVWRTFGAYHGNTEGSLNGDGVGDNIRIAWFHPSVMYTQQSASVTMSGISFLYNINSKTYTLDNTDSAPINITTTSTGAITINNPFAVDLLNISCISNSNALNKVPNVFTTNDGISLCVSSRHENATEHYVSRATIQNFDSMLNVWNMSTRVLTNRLSASIYPTYGSAVGDNLIHPTIIAHDKIFLCCSGSNNGVYFGLDNTVYSGLGSTRDYVYHSVITGGTINGFAPNVDRRLVNNSDKRYTNMITIMNGSNNTTVYGTSFIENQTTKYSGGLMNQTDFSFSSSYTLSSQTILTTLKQSIINAQLSNIVNNTTNSYIILYYVPDNTFTKSFAVVTGITDAPVGQVNTYVLLAEVDVAVSGTSITGVTVSSTRYISRGIASSGLNQTFLNRQPGLIIANYPEFTYVGIPTSTGVSSFAINFASLICKVDNSTKLLTGTPRLINTSYTSNAGSTYEVGVLPGIGFGLFENGTITDLKTKLVFKLFGTTLAQFDAMTANPASAPLERIVVVAQDVPEGFNLYFTQKVPVIINGKYSELPEQSVDLTTIKADPSNSTFYLYVSNIEGITQYQFSETELSEELYRIYIGKIETGGSSISSITSEKVTRFLKYRSSTTQRGSAIPTSTGVPSGPGTRWN